MSLRVYNTLTRQKEPFQTVRPGHVGMYVCGPTVYKPSHVGHMVGPVIFDAVKRYLTYLGYQVTLVVNITDVDDKLIVEATKQKTTVKELAERVTADYLTNIKTLNVTGIDLFPRATEHIAEIVGIIQGLIAKGFAYAIGGDVYFDISKDEDYGKLCNRDPNEMEAGARIEVSHKKRNSGDFALWKAAKPGEPSDVQFPSPWGPGRPGWHIECSAMSMKLLGETIDIHGGGDDLKFPHHENELAQSESFSGKPFARYWMHNGLMKTGQAKMSKSAGNEIVVTELLKKHHPETLRFLFLSTHYRSPIEYSEDRLVELRTALDGFYRFFERYQRMTKTSFYDLEVKTSDIARIERSSLAGLFLQRFRDGMDDDFNTGWAVGVMFELLRTANRIADDRGLDDGPWPRAEHVDFDDLVVTLRHFSSLVGLFWKSVEVAKSKDDQLVGGLMQLLIDLRNDARKSKNFAVADQIRKRLGELKITLEDRPGGTDWRVET